METEVLAALAGKVVTATRSTAVQVAEMVGTAVTEEMAGMAAKEAREVRVETEPT